MEENENIAVVQQDLPQEIPQEESAPEKKLNLKSVITYAAGCLYLLAQVVVFMIYFFGGVRVFGEGLSLWSLVNYIIKIFSVNAATAYDYVLGLALNVGYLLILIAMIRMLVTSIKQFVGLSYSTFSKNKDGEKKVSVSAIFYGCLHTVYPVFTLLIFANLIDEYCWTAAITAIAVFGGLAVVVNSIVSRLENAVKSDILQIVFQSLREILTYVTVCVIVSLVGQAAFRNFIDGAVMLFGGGIFNGAEAKVVVYSIYCNIISPVLFIVLAIQSIKLYYRCYQSSNSRIFGMALSCAIYTAVFMVLNLIFRIVLGSGSTSVGADMIGDWFVFNRRELLPLCLLFVILCVLDASGKTVKQQ